MDDAQVDACKQGCASEPAASRATDPPIACTLEPAELPDRIAGWRSVLGPAGSRTIAADGTVRVELGAAADIEGLARLVAAEQACCAFFSFAITVDGRGVGLEVRAPTEAADLVADLFGQPA
jgi:hypothetical protein